MIIGFFNPYFDGLGGGERYTLSLASHWSKAHDVRIFWDDKSLLEKAQQRFNIDLSRVKLVQNIFRGKNILKKALFTSRYDLIFFLTDGSVPTSMARNNILHVQMPFQKLTISGFKRSRYSAVVCNSLFTKNHFDPSIGKSAMVIYPPVITDNAPVGKKQKLILSVGRFHPLKKQDVLIKAFTSLVRKHIDWRLVLSGGLLESDAPYVARLKDLTKNLPISLLPNSSFEELQALYREAAIYWHAAGFGESDPLRMEHFGITTVEAMTAGCIPIVFNGGGLTEIVTDSVTGYVWNSVEELIEKTSGAIEHIKKSKPMISDIQDKTKQFDQSIFYKSFDTLLSKMK